MSSSHSSASAAEAQTTLRLQHADRLPTWLYLGLPLVAAVALFIAWRVSPQFYEAYIGSEIGILEGTQEIGRASCREKEGQAVWIAEVAVPLKKKKKTNTIR